MAFLTSDEVYDWSMQMREGEGGNAPIEQQQRQQQQQPTTTLRCPRCDSSNTKFCYYNNYNRSQPRHFCRACRRHWTVGGTLRSVPVGGARKNNNKTKRNTTKTTTTTTQPAAAPFSVSENIEEITIFPDIYRHLTFYNAPPPASSDQGGSISNFAAGSLLSPSTRPLPASVAAATNDQGIVINPLPVSAASSLAGDTAGLLDLMPGSSTSGTWVVQDLTPLPTSYYNSTWWDDTLDFTNSPGLEQYPAAAAAAATNQLRPGMD